jgi:predicted PhzF superfamily epimerase YddE/YHI9
MERWHMHLSVVDAFTDRPFSGNPAAVAVLDDFPPVDRMQAIAAEMNLSETAFAVARPDTDYDLRWFTPATEVDLCGHATLATAHVVGRTVTFHTRSGPLICSTHLGWVEMDFPAWPTKPAPLPTLPDCLPTPRWTGTAGDDWLIELPTAEDVKNLTPDLTAIAGLGRRGVIVTARAAPAEPYDIVSRVFGPNVGIPEDPVTGSAHCALATYWGQCLGRDQLVGYQASRRGGLVRMRLEQDRVVLSGQAITVSRVELLA